MLRFVNNKEGANVNCKSATLRRLLFRIGAFLAAFILAIAALLILFRGTILNGYFKAKAEMAFEKEHPGWALRIGKLDYAVGANRLMGQSVTLRTTNATLTTGRISLTGVRWTRLIFRKSPLAEVLAGASLDATNLNADFPQEQYGIQCARLRVSVPGSEWIAEGAELRMLAGDEAFFAANEFRTTRYHVIVPECRASGLAFREMLLGKPWRAGSVIFFRPTFDALVNCEKPNKPFVKPPLLLHEALASIRQPLRIDYLSITNGHAKYLERMIAGSDPGVLTFTDVNINAEGIASGGEASSSMLLRGEGRLMDAGMLKVAMTIPIGSPRFSLHYSGSLSAMDLTSLNAFLDIAEQTRIKSGTAQEAAFEIDVIDGLARGHVRAIYRDLKIALLAKQTGSEKGLGNRVASFFANVLKIRNSNVPDAAGSTKNGEINYERRPKETFLQFAWFALRSGIMDIVSH